MNRERTNLLEQLFRDHYKELVRYANKALLDPVRAEESVQEAFFEAVRHIDHLLQHDNPGDWLITMVNHNIYNKERVQKPSPLPLLSLDTGLPMELSAAKAFPEALPAQTQSADTTARRQQLFQLLTLAELHLLHRVTLGKADPTQVARELNITVLTCQKQLERIQTKLKGILFR